MIETPYLLIIIGALAQIIIGAVWYGPIFGKIWMRINGFDSKSKEEQAKLMENMWITYVLQAVLSLFTAYVMYFVVTLWQIGTPFMTTLILWFGLIVPLAGSDVLWSSLTPRMRWQKFYIVAGYNLVALLVLALLFTLV
jgi:hypothetical protein